MTQKKLKILIADDEQDTILVLKDYLEDGGYEVLEAVNGTEALRAIRTEGPDLVLLDLRMPEIDGEKILEILQKEDAGVRMKFFVLTGFNDFDITRERIKARYPEMVARYIEKPVDLDKLGEAIAAYAKRGELES